LNVFPGPGDGFEPSERVDTHGDSRLRGARLEVGYDSLLRGSGTQVPTRHTMTNFKASYCAFP
jgi:hypothetical protein